MFFMYKKLQKTLAIFTFYLKVYSLTYQGGLWYIYYVNLYGGDECACLIKTAFVSANLQKQ